MTSGKSGSSQKEKNGSPVQHLTLRARLFLFSILMIVPFFALALYLLFNLNAIAGYYSTIVSNITKVNAYNLVFKDDMDSVMYMMVAHSMSKYEVGPELGITNPDEMIREAEEAFEDVRGTTVSDDALENIDRASKLLTTLHKRGNDINSTVKVTGHYDENMESLDGDIYMLTEMIQERISEYIYYESVSMENTREQMEERRSLLVRFAIVTAFGLLLLSFLLTSMLTRSINKPLQNLIAVGRNKGMSVILATQNMESFKSRHFDFYANAQYPLIMKQQQQNDTVIKDLFGVSGAALQEIKLAIAALQKGELITKDAANMALGIGKHWQKIKVTHLI